MTADTSEVETKEQRNARVQRRWDELSKRNRHGHYETLFALVREEIQLTYAECADLAEEEADKYLDGQSLAAATTLRTFADLIRNRIKTA